MKKGQDAKQEGILDEIKETHPNLTLIKPIEFARLFYPKDFHFENKPRLYREVTEKVIQSFNDYHYATRELPTSYKVKIITSRGFNDCLQSIFRDMAYVDKKQESEEPDKQLSFMMYYNFFNIGIEGLIKSMPEEFRYTLQDQIRPVLLLMQAITRFTLQSGSKKKVPFVHAPDFMIQKGLTGETLQ